MKAFGLLLLRVALSGLVAVWAAARIVAPEGGVPALDVWFPSVALDPLSVRLAGGLAAFVAFLVLTGFFRLAAYPLLLAGLVAAAVAAWPFPSAPIDLVSGGVSFFLLLAALAVAALLPLAFYDEDRLSLDRLAARRPIAAAAAVAASVPDEPAPSTEEMSPAAHVEPAAAVETVETVEPVEAEAAPACEVPAPEPVASVEAAPEVSGEEPEQAPAHEVAAAEPEPSETEKSAA
ncbi:MAG: hypothetical protein Q7U42_11870 [Parvibaculum sp.]|nr:hypothetical protein [Parvibaculum sp.]